MNRITIKSLFVSAVIAACLSLLTYAIFYLIAGNTNDYFFRFIALFIAESVLIGAHFWIRSSNYKSNFQKLIFNLVRVELGLSMLALLPLAFSWFEASRALTLFVILQLIHGALYMCYTYLFDDENSDHKNLTDEEIINISKRSPFDPSSQDSD